MVSTTPPGDLVCGSQLAIVYIQGQLKLTAGRAGSFHTHDEIGIKC